MISACKADSCQSRITCFFWIHVIADRSAHIITYMKNWRLVALVCTAGVLCIALIAAFSLKSASKPVDNGNSVAVADGKPVTRNDRRNRVRVRKSERIRTVEAKDARKKPTFSLDDDDEAKLNEEQRKTIEAIRAALDAENKPRVLKLVQALQASDEWPDGIPKSIKMAAIEALGWFGSSCLPEIAGFLGDSDPDVVQSAIEKYEEALSDFELGDRERSKILIEASKVINDAEAIDSMLFELNNMRHSVAVETIKELMVSGNEAAKSVLPDNIEFYTGEEGIKTPEQLDEWLEKNPDDEGDDEFYGPSKD